MFCPKCKTEYSDGFYKCADCGTDLVTEQPPEFMEEISYVDLVEIYSTYQQSDIAFIKSVLDGEGIRYFFSGEGTTLMVGAGAYARLLVDADDVSRTRDILRELGFLEKF
jgi:hypothetical protein